MPYAKTGTDVFHIDCKLEIIKDRVARDRVKKLEEWEIKPFFGAYDWQKKEYVSREEAIKRMKDRNA